MTPLAIAKGALVVAGMLIFFLGIRGGSDLLRWTGIALVVVAWLLRFVRTTSGNSSPTSSRDHS